MENILSYPISVVIRVIPKPVMVMGFQRRLTQGGRVTIQVAGGAHQAPHKTRQFIRRGKVNREEPETSGERRTRGQLARSMGSPRSETDL